MGVRDSVSIGQEVEPRHPQDVASAESGRGLGGSLRSVLAPLAVSRNTLLYPASVS